MDAFVDEKALAGESTWKSVVASTAYSAEGTWVGESASGVGDTLAGTVGIGSGGIPTLDAVGAGNVLDEAGA